MEDVIDLILDAVVLLIEESKKEASIYICILKILIQILEQNIFGI